MKSTNAIFGGYDVRGIYPSDLDEKAALRAGIAFGGFLKKSKLGHCIVGMDNRKSSKPLKEAMVRGLTEYCGIKVTDIGLAPTSTLCFALMEKPSWGGVSVTASHNPVQYNGMKFYSGNAMPLFSDELAWVKKEYEKTAAPKTQSTRQGNVAFSKMTDRHAAFAASRHKLKRKLKVAFDCGNSVCALVGPAMFRKLGCEVVELFCELDGSFPNHLPDPHKEENYPALVDAVKKNRADLGVMFDGDGDRAGFVDEKGRIVACDFANMLFIRDLLTRKKGAVAVLDLRLSRAVFEDASRHGGVAVMSKAGRMCIHEEMARIGADYGGEVTGHVSFAQNGSNDDAFFASARMAEIISKSDEPLSKIVDSLPRYFSPPEMRVGCPNERKFKVVEAVRRSLARKYPVNTLDGVRVDFEQSWGLLRVSNTEPQVTLRFEGKTKERLAEIFGIFETEMEKQGIALPKI